MIKSVRSINNKKLYEVVENGYHNFVFVYKVNDNIIVKSVAARYLGDYIKEKKVWDLLLTAPRLLEKNKTTVKDLLKNFERNIGTDGDITFSIYKPYKQKNKQQKKETKKDDFPVEEWEE